MTLEITNKNDEKRKERRKQTGEDFTPSWLVVEMLNKLTMYDKNCWKDPRKTFIDLSCGNGNFLVEIVNKKLKLGHRPLDVAKTVFGLDIMNDNIFEARCRLCCVFDLYNCLDEYIIMEICKNVRKVDDSLKVDFNETVFKRKKPDKEKIERIIRKIKQMNEQCEHLKSDIKEREMSKIIDFIKKYFYNNEHIKSIQNVHTPFDFANSIVKKLEDYNGLKNDKSFLTFNLEFVTTLLQKGVNSENITFISECEDKVNFAKIGLKVNSIHDNFVSGNIKDGFDVVIGNPPYQAPKSKENEGRGKCGNSLWEEFVKMSINVCKKDGYVCLIHPSGWRRPENKIGSLIKDKKIHYLEIHDLDDGMKTFNAQTRYDWYIMQNGPASGETIIKDEDGIVVSKSIQSMPFIPNGKIDEIMSLVAKPDEEKIEILHSYSFYETRKLWMSKEKNEVHIYPCVYSINSKGKVTFWYSSKKDAHFGIPKVIFPSGAFQSVDVMIDENGDYGLTQFARGIVDRAENLPLIAKALRSEKFIQLYFKITMGSTELDKQVLKHFRKDFWKSFI